MTDLSPSQVERTKLTANFFNTVAAGTVLTALITPAVGIALGTAPADLNLLNLSSFSLFGLAMAAVLHLLARRMLLRLDD